MYHHCLLLFHAYHFVFPYPVTPVPNLSKDTMKQTPHIDLLNEKRRLTVKLEEAKHRKMLKRDIKQPWKQIEQSENGTCTFLIFI